MTYIRILPLQEYASVMLCSYYCSKYMSTKSRKFDWMTHQKIYILKCSPTRIRV